MKFGPLSLDQAGGKILGHHIAGPDGRRAFRKGKPLTAEDIKALRQLGRCVVYVAELEPGDVGEDTAAKRVARAVAGSGLRLTRPHLGRVNLQANQFGVLRVDAGRLLKLNECEGITLATMGSHTVVQPRKTVATVKVIPFAVPEQSIRQAEEVASSRGPLITITALPARKVSVILSGSPFARQRVVENFVPPLQERVESLGSEIASLDFVPLEGTEGEEELSNTLHCRVKEGAALVVLAGETAIMDRYDIAPRAVERAGGEIVCFGAPVDPGNLLMLAYLGEVPVLGAPGCARSPKMNVIDWVLPRLLAGERLNRADILALGYGGLLEDTPLRPMPRNGLD